MMGCQVATASLPRTRHSSSLVDLNCNAPQLRPPWTAGTSGKRRSGSARTGTGLIGANAYMAARNKRSWSHSSRYFRATRMARSFQQTWPWITLERHASHWHSCRRTVLEGEALAALSNFEQADVNHCNDLD